MSKFARALSGKEFDFLSQEDDVLLLDVRDKREFGQMHIPGAIFIGLDGSFAPWVGALIENLQQKIILVTPKGREEEAVKRLARVGYDNSLGYLDGGMETWQTAGKPTERLKTISVQEFIAENKANDSLRILDVRKPDEWETAHLDNAQHFPLDFINQHMAEINPKEEYHVHCRSGYRSTVASSILLARGYTHLINVHGSFDDIKSSSLSVSGSCPSLQSK